MGPGVHGDHQGRQALCSWCVTVRLRLGIGLGAKDLLEPPRDLTWSATSGRGSVARTMAPRLEAAPIAASPATPAPATGTLAGGYPARRGDLAGEEPADGARRFDDRPVPGD